MSRVGLKTKLYVLAVVFVAGGWIGVARASDIIATIPDGAITGRMLAGEAVVSSKIARRAVTADKIGIRAVTRGHLADSAVDSYKVRDGSLSGVDVRDGTIAGPDIASGAISQSQAPFALAGPSTGFRLERGQVTLAVDSAGQTGPVTAGFAKAFATAPLVFVSFSDVSANTLDFAGTSVVNLSASATTTQVSVKARVTDPGAPTSTAVVNWVAIGK